MIWNEFTCECQLENNHNPYIYGMTSMQLALELLINYDDTSFTLEGTFLLNGPFGSGNFNDEAEKSRKLVVFQSTWGLVHH